MLVDEKLSVSPGFGRMSSFRVTNRALWFLNCGPSTRNACIKGVLLSYCSQFAEIYPAFYLNRRILGISYWLGLCIDRKLFAEGLGYCIDHEAKWVGQWLP